MKSRVLTVLMWKHAVVRVRRFIHTAVDFASPLLFFILIFSFKDNIRPQVSSSEERDPVAYTEVLSLSETRDGPHRLYYFPDTPLTESLMDDVGPKLSLNRVIYKPEIPNRGFYGIANKTELNAVAAKMHFFEVLIIFQDMTGETWPERLNYTIRMKDDFQTERYEPVDSMPGPHKMFGLSYGTFMQVQWAVDTSYIKLLTGNEVPQSISVQEFPYYHTRRNKETTVFCDLLMVVCWLSLVLTFVFLMCRLLQERTSGIQELMKMVGVSLNTLGVSHFLNVLPCGLIFSIGGSILLTVSNNPIIPNTNGFLIFLMLLLYFNSVVAMAFACSYITKSTQYAATLSVLTYICLWFPTRLVSSYNLPSAVYIITGFLPHRPMQWFWMEVSAVEMFGRGITFGNMATVQGWNNASVLLSFIFLIIQAAIFYFLAWYLSLVRPGQYGQALPWNFLFKKSKPRKRKKKLKKKSSVELTENGYSDSEDSRNEYSNDELTSDVTSYYEKKYDVRWVKPEYTHANRRPRHPWADRYPSSGDSERAAQYWRNEVIPTDTDSDERELVGHDPRFFEQPPSRAEVGIKVDDVSKVYPKQKALKNVSLEVLKGEITVLVGHNGAGKTTLMSIITGMTSATEGRVYVNGLDTVAQRDAVRKNIGLCPQHNLFFPDLTVQEHIMFFTMLKRGTYSEARQSSRQLAERLGISDKLSTLPRALSGGMKRRAQLACALAGGAQVLVLDEPTSGLDVETRRELWDLLLSLRGERTVLLSTHFMEEADALGDRVAALHAGTLRCFATTMHLKKAVGTGYRLSLTTIGTPNVPAITSVVTSHVPDASIKEQTINSISYNLPATATSKFPKLFSSLESKRSKLGIDSIGVGVSTLEEVFLKLCSDVDTQFSEDEVDQVQELKDRKPTLRGFPLYMRQFCVLFKRQIKYAIHKKWTFLILQLILPITMIMTMTRLMNNSLNPQSRALAMNLDVYSDRSDRRVLYKATPDINMEPVMNRFTGVSFTNSDDVAEAVLRTAERDILEYNKYLVGVEVNETDAKILYTTTVRHAAPVALNLLTNMLATRYISWADGRTISTVNSPILGENRLTDMKTPKDTVQLVTWGLCITFILLATNINCISLPCKERQTGSRHIHVMSGCPAELHWTTTLVFHMCLTVVGLIVPTVIAAVLLDEDNTINRIDMLGTFALVLLLGSMSFFAFMYLVSFNFGERTTSIILVACIMIFGVVTPFIKIGHELFEDTSRDFTYYLLVLCGYIMTPHTMVTASLKCLYVGKLNAWCDMMKPYCPVAYVNERHFNMEKCCAGQNPACYFCMETYSPGPDMLILFIQFVLMMTMVMLTQRGYFNGLIDKLLNAGYRPTESVQMDEMVAAEKAYVSKAIALPEKQIQDAMLVDDLHKNYVSVFAKKCNAVKGVSFSVKKGECFGLLGVNGAGKSSTFKMLTAEECATRGSIFANGYRLKRGNPKYLQSLGYCPQFFGLDMFLTGQDNLSLVLTLRGYDKQHVKQEVKSWIETVGLEKYARRRVEAYSGGCVRRLGAAAALCGGAGLVLLDEPSAGVDVAARRRLWTALRRGLKQQRSVIITSHSMDEMEALCSRIAIMSGGRVRALGSAAALRAHHASGHAVVFKVGHDLHTRSDFDEVDSPSKGVKLEINKLKAQLQEKFNCTLKDEHKTMLHYHINETMRYSDLFSALEALRESYPNLIEDYSVTETTLEEVFLAFAKEQQANTETV